MPPLDSNMQGGDLADDLSCFDGRETVTITQAGTLDEQEVESVVRRPLSLRELEASAGVYARGDMKFHVPTDGLSFAPAAGDTITDADAQDWNIQEVELLALTSRYRLWCKPA